jgi:NADH-quinone oxidoreductase subunit J
MPLLALAAAGSTGAAPAGAPAAASAAGDPLYVLAFWLFAALAVAPALMLVASRDVVRAAFLLLGSLAGVAGLYGLLGADFVAFTQVVVYIGGILILLLFGVMLTSRDPVVVGRAPTHALVAPGVLAGGIALLSGLWVALRVPWRTAPAAARPTSTELGELLTTRWVLPFEVVSVLLLAALLGAAAIARRKGDTREPD